LGILIIIILLILGVLGLIALIIIALTTSAVINCSTNYAQYDGYQLNHDINIPQSNLELTLTVSSSLNVSSLSTCESYCDSSSACTFLVFDSLTGNCSLYSSRARYLLTNAPNTTIVCDRKINGLGPIFFGVVVACIYTTNISGLN
jgi:hypothetical protein